jgi:hypothetical protein
MNRDMCVSGSASADQYRRPSIGSAQWGGSQSIPTPPSSDDGLSSVTGKAGGARFCRSCLCRVSW